MVERMITVSDLDRLTAKYQVVDECGRSIGEKQSGAMWLDGFSSGECVYLKPEYTKRGQRLGGKHAGFDCRLYRTTPPWIKYEVIKIDTLGGSLTFHTRKVVDGK